jgi:aminopeptidase N
MKYIISEPRLSMFLRRRFSPEDLLWIVNDVHQMIDEGYGVESAVYDGIRDFIKSKKFTEIDEFGDEQSYWDSYLKYEIALVSYVKSQLGLD